SLARRRDARGTGLHARILRRGALLFGIGVLLNAFPRFEWGDVHVLGVLQRIALAYVVASLVALHVRPRRQVVLAAGLLVGYWLVLTAGGPLTPAGNLAGAVDRAVLGARHLYNDGPYDPEGLLGTFPAVVSVLLGYWIM